MRGETDSGRLYGLISLVASRLSSPDVESERLKSKAILNLFADNRCERNALARHVSHRLLLEQVGLGISGETFSRFSRQLQYDLR